nr:uncharacterized protein LOC133611918 [Nerophis lumbriciformis]
MCERRVAEYEEELSPTKRKNERRQRLQAVLKKHHRPDAQQLIGRQEEGLPQPLGRRFTLKQEAPQPPHYLEEEEEAQAPHIKKEEEELWITQEEECLLGQGEADLTKFPLTVVSVKTEGHEEKPPESSQLHHSPNVQQLIGYQEEPLLQLKEEPQPPHIKEEEEELWITQEEERNLGQEEADLTKFPLTVVSVKTEDHEVDHLIAPLSSDSDDASHDNMVVYVVVEFLGEHTVSAVPEIWTAEDEEGLFCYWPSTNVSTRIRRGEMPDKELWGKIGIRIFPHSFTECYEKALRYAKQIEFSSNIETEQEDPIGKRKRRTPERYRETEAEDMDGDDENDESPEKRPKYDELQNYVVPLPNAPVYAGRPQIRRSLTPSSTHTPSSNNQRSRRRALSALSPSKTHTPSSKDQRSRRRTLSALNPSKTHTPSSKNQCSRRRSPTPSTSQASGSGSRRHAHTNEAVQFNINLQTILSNQDEILRLLRVISAKSTGGEPVDVRDLIPEKLTTVDQLNLLCEKLQADEDFRRKLIKALSAIGGANLVDGVRAIVKNIGQNKLWENYSLTGRKGKLPLKDLSICRVIVKACQMTFNSVKTQEVYDELTEVLKYAPHRRGGSKHKVGKRKRDENDHA